MSAFGIFFSYHVIKLKVPETKVKEPNKDNKIKGDNQRGENKKQSGTR